MISNHFPLSALIKDRTLILTWDIETQSQELGEFAEVLDLNHNVFMICMTLHWKDDPKLIKQICLVDVEIGAKSENVFKRKGKNTNEEGTVWGSGEKVEEEEEYLGGLIKIKITVEDDFYSSFLKLLGCVPIDVRVCLKKHFPKAEVEKEEAKKDPSPSTARKMREVANYCIIDALCCQELMVKPNIINDYREVASIAYVFDSHYHANGMKVRNLLDAYAFKRDILFNTRVCKHIEKGKYFGAYVYPPKKGIETRRPVTGLDFASLYPSLIMAYNLSSDKIILTKREANIAQNNGNILHKIEFPFNNRTIQAWSVRHDNQFEKKGLYPVVLENLYEKKAELKMRLATLGKKKLQLGKIISSAKKRGKRTPESLISEYSTICFDYALTDLKQRALKVYMNTFYGEAENSKSSIFLRELAGGITSAGKYNLSFVAEFVTKKGFGIKYGDTDSLYLTCPEKYYEKCNGAFSRKELSKEGYWTEMVEITMNVMKSLRDQVNAYLRIKSGTSCLKLAYEEVLFPVCFAGKKKYFGVPHEEEAMDMNNTRSIHKIVKDTLREAQNKEWDFNKFIIMGTWKPKKKNLCNNRFMKRMRERNERIPDPSERFSYVVVKGLPLYNKEGRKKPHRIGDFMEYTDIAKEQNMEIDINYYLGITVAMCVCFINEDDSFQLPPSDKIMQTDIMEKEIDEYSQKKAKNCLKKYIKSLQ
ncbi:hypothetical protein RclHR1_27790004 [Rhizophagus clarus]|uniref:DNA polymerase n=1 Tax=Rhizophagus clarus TaxID=94130 RepID=A0A2Z6RWX0_9GLOM|nr:hypothetical protein RclHR1_27790004 [Rhizophagus clarus]